MEQLRQLQLQQQMLYATMPIQSYGEQMVPKEAVVNSAPTNKNFVPNNPGFQMNPVSKHKKNSAKEKV